MIKKTIFYKTLLNVSVFLILFCSNMVASQILGSFGRNMMWVLGLCLLFFVNKRYNARNIILLLGIAGIRAIIMLFQFNFTPEFLLEFIGFLLTINFLMQVGQLFTAEEYAKTLVNIMVIICAVSLIGYTILMSASDEWILSISQLDGRFNHNYIYVWGWDNFIFNRNAGPWWEPGAFQCFIAMAMIMIMSGRCDDMKWKRLKLIILLTAWITTQSTTGYIIMALIILLMYKTIAEIIFGKKFYEIKSWKIFLMAVVLVGAVIFFYNTLGGQVIHDKLNMQHDSTATRYNDVISSLNISLENPIVGTGHKYTKYYDRYGIGNNSAALLTIPIMHGWIYFILY